MFEARVSSSFRLLMNSINLYGYTTFCFPHSPVNKHLYCSHFLTFMNNVALNFHVQVLLKAHVFTYLVTISMSQMARLLNINFCLTF